MVAINIKKNSKVIPQCYAYTTPGVPAHDGWTKIGFTERDVETRINEQTAAVQKTMEYFKGRDNAEFLWNAKPRFGKTLSAYDLCMKLGAKNILIVTNRPAIANSWYQDYETFSTPELREV